MGFWILVLFSPSCFVHFVCFNPRRLSPLCRETLNDIMTRGHSRVPVYAGKPTNIIGLVLVIHFFLLLWYFFWIIDINDSTYIYIYILSVCTMLRWSYLPADGENYSLKLFSSIYIFILICLMHVYILMRAS